MPGCAPLPSLRLFVILRRVDVQVRPRVVRFHQLHFVRHQLQKILKSLRLGVRQFFKILSRQNYRVQSVPSPARLANLVPQRSRKIYQLFQHLSPQMWLVAECNDKVRCRSTPSIPLRRAAHRTEHAFARHVIYDPVSFGKSQPVQFRREPFIIGRLHRPLLALPPVLSTSQSNVLSRSSHTMAATSLHVPSSRNAPRPKWQPKKRMAESPTFTILSPRHPPSGRPYRQILFHPLSGPQSATLQSTISP